MDGEDLIICIAIWTLYKLWRPLISDDLRVRSVAPQNEFRFIDRSIDLWMDFGRFGEANLEGKIDF